MKKIIITWFDGSIEEVPISEQAYEEFLQRTDVFKTLFGKNYTAFNLYYARTIKILDELDND